MASSQSFTIWQWNTSTLRTRRETLQQFIGSVTQRPAVILLQETRIDRFALRGYRVEAVYGNKARGIATCVAKPYAYTTHAVRPDLKIEHQMIEIIPTAHIKQSIFILNVYSSPSHSTETFTTLVTKAMQIAGNHPLIIAGDFQCPPRRLGLQSHNTERTPLTSAHHSTQSRVT